MRFYEAGQEVRNSTRTSKPESESPCGAEICVDDVSEPEDLDHSAQPSASCGTDGERGGESGVRSPKKVQDPRVPTQAEVYEHNMTHLPYRSWCAHCVRGRGEAHPHNKSGDEERDVIAHGAPTASAGAERLTRTTNLEMRSAMSQSCMWTTMPAKMFTYRFFVLRA